MRDERFVGDYSTHRLAERGKRKVVIVFDEVQQVLECENDVVERRLRSIIQKHNDVSCIFLGNISSNVA